MGIINEKIVSNVINWAERKLIQTRPNPKEITGVLTYRPAESAVITYNF